MRNAAAKAREIESDVYLPFGRHVTDTVISLSTRALITVIKIDGTSFETAEAADLNDLHAKLNPDATQYRRRPSGAVVPFDPSPDIGLSERHFPLDIRSLP